MLFRSDPKSYKVMGAILFVEVMMVVSGAFAARGNVKCDYCHHVTLAARILQVDLLVVWRLVTHVLSTSASGMCPQQNQG